MAIEIFETFAGRVFARPNAISAPLSYHSREVFGNEKLSVPSSFKGPHGKIVYKLEAKLSRSWRMDQSVEQKILFVSRCYPNLHSMMLPQIGATKKEMGLFSKGQADMEVTIDRMAYAPGETITVLAKINNSSSSEMTPKFRLDKKLIYRASGSTKREESTIIKVVENRIQAHTELEAYLDISFAFDPEVLFPLVVVPLGFAPVPQPGVAAGPYPAGAVGGPSNSDFPPPAVSGHPYPVSPSSGRSGNPGAPMHSAPPPPVYPVFIFCDSPSANCPNISNTPSCPSDPASPISPSDQPTSFFFTLQCISNGSIVQPDEHRLPGSIG
ncbi:hypothetical protein NQZ68_003780 [Dissostichus eleginoides]|nr:hypothetical protein NQZ68_003780 [Dissostichus eleginoides]